MPESRLQSGFSAVLGKSETPLQSNSAAGFVYFKDCGFLCGCNWEPMFLRFWGLCIKPNAFNAARNPSSGNPRGRLQGVIPRKGFLTESPSNAWVSMQ